MKAAREQNEQQSTVSRTGNPAQRPNRDGFTLRSFAHETHECGRKMDGQGNETPTNRMDDLQVIVLIQVHRDSSR